MSRWEHRDVIIDFGNWPPCLQWISGEQLDERAVFTLYDYLEQLGNDGWEMIVAPATVSGSSAGWHRGDGERHGECQSDLAAPTRLVTRAGPGPRQRGAGRVHHLLAEA